MLNLLGLNQPATHFRRAGHVFQNPTLLSETRDCYRMRRIDIQIGNTMNSPCDGRAGTTDCPSSDLSSGMRVVLRPWRAAWLSAQHVRGVFGT